MYREISTYNSGYTILEYSVIGKGRPILLFHGGHSSCNEEFGYQKLLASGYSIITPSRAGYGSTSRMTDLVQACHIYQLLLDHLAIEKVHVIAVSAGGPTGIMFCSMFPDRVASFTLQSAVTKPWLTTEDKEYKIASRIFNPEAEKRTWRILATINSLLPRLTFRMMVSSFSKLPYSEVRKRIDAQAVEAFCKMNNRQRSYSVFFIDLEQTQRDYSTELAAIQAPTLIMHSQNDSSVSLIHPENAKALIPNSEICMLDSWGHLIWIGKHAAEYDNALISFLSLRNNG
ncbi:alpha/beta fold hydrolase [Paenibacillus planticolens]|uniref:Alpha/beta fold hydrolase n=1 Tax=Paenibacillus planticolens TaxID=2654976 RepID=A0ABX1ZET7_9BACL|nr:alpha/beta hydrolase [Paenibacillus planticolens]NOU98613.1 alpha/beta fold hydrolase [Paenibacillus planticolens]